MRGPTHSPSLSGVSRTVRRVSHITAPVSVLPEDVAASHAAVWRVLSAEVGGLDTHVVDVGGGTGGFAVPLALRGARVTVVDVSPDALAALARRAQEYGVMDRVTGVQGDAEMDVDRLAHLVGDRGADLMLCHSVLDLVESPAGVAANLARLLRDGGALSVIVGNRPGAVLAKVAAGQFGEALACLSGVGAERRLFDHASLAQLLSGAGLSVEQVHGVRVFEDLWASHFHSQEASGLSAPVSAASLSELELACSAMSPYRDVAAQLHVLARKDSQRGVERLAPVTNRDSEGGRG